MGGPFWAEPLHDPDWVAGLLAQVKRDKDMWVCLLLRGCVAARLCVAASRWLRLHLGGSTEVAGTWFQRAGRLLAPAALSLTPRPSLPPAPPPFPPPLPVTPLCSLPGFAKVHSILTNVSEELNDVPLYFNLHDM